MLSGQLRKASAPFNTPKLTGILADLSHSYANQDERSRFGMRIAHDERSESYSSFIVGVVKDKRYRILTAPTNKENVLIPIAKDDVWLCRLFNTTTVFRFMGRVLKVGYDPIPYIHMELPKEVERRMVRRQPRALASLAASLHQVDGDPAVVVDISVSGVRLAVPVSTQLQKSAIVPLFITIPMLDRCFQVAVNAKITANFGANDRRYPEVHFYGAQFEELNDTAALVLHGYVQEQLAEELSRLSRALAIEAAYEASMEAWLSKK
jgi:Flagellar protein YcgR/PilZ domain